VLIAPRAIGVPVAAEPGFGPHDDVLTLALLELLELFALVEPLGVLDDLLLPQPARKSIPATAASKAMDRVRGHRWWFLTSLLLR
jgi:hypothetical protein